jgi:hypothetical protein
VLISECTRALLKDDPPAGVALRDLGEYRLKDFPRAENLYQVAVEGLPAEFPALRSLAATPDNPAVATTTGNLALASTPTNLVTQLTRFIGRERDLEQTRELLKNARLVTIAGAGGLGKTRLSIELAASVSGVFNAGVWFIELAGLSDASLVPHAVATVVGVRESANEPLETTLSRHLGSLRALIVLDNCEHLVEGLRTVDQMLLQRCPVLTVLATSREVLEVPGEVVWRLNPLALPQGEHADGVDEALRSEALRCSWIERPWQIRRSDSTSRTQPASQRSVRDSMAFRWPWSWPPRASLSCRWRISPRGSRIGFARCEVGAERQPRASRLFEQRSTGATSS